MIALDAMGGDFAPQVTVIGAYQAACKGVSIQLFGPADQLRDLLDRHDKCWQRLPITLVNCTQVIGMAQDPARAVLANKDSSLVQAFAAVARGAAHAVVSAGNSGACLVAGMVHLGKINGIQRPAIANFLPGKAGSFFCLDLGANADCKPEYLEQFAFMGHAYVSVFSHTPNPRIALLSNGSEPYKGSLLVKQAYRLLEASSLNFVGNIEPKEVFDGAADVVVCDGFSGNIMLKALQGTASLMGHWLQEEYRASWMTKIAGALSMPVLKKLKNRGDYARKGGALLLGVHGTVVIAHGCSSAQAIENAILYAHASVQDKVIERFSTALSALLPAQENQPVYDTPQESGSVDITV